MTTPLFPLPPAPSIPELELKTRLERTRLAMANAKVDFLVLTSRSNFEYYTGHVTHTWAYHSRPLFALVAPKKLIVVGSNAEVRNIEQRPRHFDTKPYTGYLAASVKALIDVIAAEDAACRATIAIDYGQDNFGRGSFELVDGLRARNGHSAVVAGADLVWSVRMIKSPFEASLKRTSLQIVDAAFDGAIADAYIGMTEIELQRDLQSRIILKGAERADPVAMLFSKGDFIYSRPASERRLEEGHYIWTDFRSTYGGYPADRNRIARAGEPAAWEIQTYAAVRALTLTLCKSARPGMTGSDLYTRFAELWREADLGSAYGAISRVGHGGGMDVTEPPSIAADSMEVLQSGMILHLEPKLERNGAVFQFEEIVLIRDEGVEFLCALQPEHIPVVSKRSP
jgi:Xaa-Pro dipeptidase